MSANDYFDGWDDGKANRDPQFERLALGAHRCNDYERGYLDSGFRDEPRLPRPPKDG